VAKAVVVVDREEKSERRDGIGGSERRITLFAERDSHGESVATTTLFNLITFRP